MHKYIGQNIKHDLKCQMCVKTGFRFVQVCPKNGGKKEQNSSLAMAHDSDTEDPGVFVY